MSILNDRKEGSFPMRLFMGIPINSERVNNFQHVNDNR